MWQQMLNHPIPFFKNKIYRLSPHINLLILNRQSISEKLKNFQKQVIYKIFIKYFAPKLTAHVRQFLDLPLSIHSLGVISGSRFNFREGVFFGVGGLYFVCFFFQCSLRTIPKSAHGWEAKGCIIK